MSETLNTGHGHVYPRPDGVVARCGGPSICKECARDASRLQAAGEHAAGVLAHQYTDPNSVLTSLLDAMKGQLLIVMVNRLGGRVSIPVADVDGTGAWMLSMSVDQERGLFIFETGKKS